MRSRLAIFWFLYMAGLGIFFPYYSLYLRQNLGLSNTQVGLVMSMIPLVGLVTQPLWGTLADRTGSRRLVLAMVVLGVALANLGLGFLGSFKSALLGTAALAVFSTVVLSMSTAVTLGSVAPFGPNAFGQVRMFGTLGFLAAVVVFPRFLERSPRLDLAALHWSGLGQIFAATALLSLLAAGMALALPRSPALTIRSEKGDFKRLLRHPPALRLLFLVFAAHICLQGPINLFPLYITDRGGDVASIGKMWIFMLLLEIPLIGFSGQTLRRLGPRGLLTMGLLAEGVRWTTCALTTDLQIIRAVMLLHGVGVAGILIGAPLYLERAVPARLRSTGQTLLASAGFGAGAMISVSGGGWLFDHFGSGTFYALAGAGASILGLLVFRLLPEPYRPAEPGTEPDSTSDSPTTSADRALPD